MRALAVVFCFALAACCSSRPAQAPDPAPPPRPAQAPSGNLAAAVDSLKQLALDP